MIAKAAAEKRLPPAPEPAFHTAPVVAKETLAMRGARTGWNPDPAMIGEVKTYVPEPAAPEKPQKPPRGRGKTPRATPVAVPSPERAPASIDAALDRAKARVRATANQPKPPSRAVTGPKLRSDRPAYRNRWAPPNPAAAAQPVVVSTQRSPPPRAAPTPAPQATAQAAPARLKPGYMPASRWAPPVAKPVPKAPVHVGGGKYGAVVGGVINASQAIYAEMTQKKKK